MCAVPAAAVAVLTYREHQKVNAYNAGVTEGVRRLVLKTLEQDGMTITFNKIA